ncbi:MAG: hypothetical protein IKZ87_00785 [Actinomycetaceae bacterium]|nr:hypothetical protein [Actinomycetaceae bacterium]
MPQKKHPFFTSGVTLATSKHYRRLVRRQVNQAIPDRNLDKNLRDLDESDLLAAAERLCRYAGELASATRRIYKAALVWSLLEIRKEKGEDWGIDVERKIQSVDLSGSMRNGGTLRRVPERFEVWLREQNTLTGLQVGVQRFFLANMRVGLRPVEWFGCKLLCPWPPVDGYNEILHIRSAKVTHGRGRGYWREISLASLTPEHMNDVLLFLAYLNRWIDASRRWRNVDFEKCDVETRAIASRSFYHPLKVEWWKMRRQLIKDGVLAPNEANLAFYSTRHQAVASAKRELNPDDVARVFGHAVPETARIWYGWRRDGRNSFGVLPYADAKSLQNSQEMEPAIIAVPNDGHVPTEAEKLEKHPYLPSIHPDVDAFDRSARVEI